MADTSKHRRVRRQFDDHVKAQAVRLVLDEAKSIGVVSRDLDLTERAVREWVKRARADRTHGKTGLTWNPIVCNTWRNSVFCSKQ